MKSKTWLLLTAASILCFQKLASLASALVSANQFLDQYPPQMRSAIMAIGTHILFQLSSRDADKMAAALDGGKHLAEILKNLPQRNLVVEIRPPPSQPRGGAGI